MCMEARIIFFLSQFISVFILTEVVCEWLPKTLDLPHSHATRFLNSFKDEAQKCHNSNSCIYKNILDTGLCWGYESNCPQHLGYSSAHCPGDHKGWVSSKSQQLQTFISQADFGFVKQQILSKTIMCKPTADVSLLFWYCYYWTVSDTLYPDVNLLLGGIPFGVFQLPSIL